MITRGVGQATNVVLLSVEGIPPKERAFCETAQRLCPCDRSHNVSHDLVMQLRLCINQSRSVVPRAACVRGWAC
eukprot:3423164-Prymnesium_polylepis.1